MADFAGRVALVTGATRGIGLGIAQELVSTRGAGGHHRAQAARARRGGRRPGSARTSPWAYAAVQTTRPTRPTPSHRRSRASAAWTCLVNNAAVNPQYGPLVDADLSAVRKVFEVNVHRGPRLGAAGLARRDERRTAAASSTSRASAGSGPAPRSARTTPARPPSSTSTRQLGVELGPTVRVNAIAPAVVKTRFAAALYEGREEEVAADYPMKRLGVPEDTAKAAVFLLSDDAALDHRRDAGRRRRRLGRPLTPGRARTGSGGADRGGVLQAEHLDGPLAHLDLADLAGHRHREVLAGLQHVDVARDLVVREPAVGERPDRLGGQRLARPGGA